MEYKKMSLIGIGLLALMALGFAWDAGNTLTTEQFREIDMEKHEFALKSVGNEVRNVETEDGIFRFYYTIESFEPNSLMGYEEVEKEEDVVIELLGYNECRSEGGSQTECTAELKASLIAMVLSNREAEREIQQQEQKKTNYALEIDVNSITITAEELNAARLEG